MNNVIEFYRKNVYGAEKFYIKDARMRKAITTLTGRMTINGPDMSALKWLGFSFIEVLAPRD